MGSQNAEHCWLADKGLTLSSGSHCLYKFAGLSRPCWYGSNLRLHDDCSCTTHGWADHLDVWNLDGKPVAFTSQPYGLSGEAMQDAAAVAAKLGLQLSIDARSWHDSHTILLLFLQPGFSLFS